MFYSVTAVNEYVINGLTTVDLGSGGLVTVQGASVNIVKGGNRYPLKSNDSIPLKGSVDFEPLLNKASIKVLFLAN